MIHQLQAFWQQFKAHLYAEVPAEVAACEFYCRELNCTAQTWEDCPKRQQKEQAIHQLRNPE